MWILVNKAAYSFKSLEILTPFVTTYLCEQSFSRLVDIKTNERNRLCLENDMRVALAKAKPRISELVFEKTTTKGTLICSTYTLSYIFVWNSCFVGFLLWTHWFCVQLLHGSFCALMNGSVNASVKLAWFSISDKVKNHCYRK